MPMRSLLLLLPALAACTEVAVGAKDTLDPARIVVAPTSLFFTPDAATQELSVTNAGEDTLTVTALTLRDGAAFTRAAPDGTGSWTLDAGDVLPVRLVWDALVDGEDVLTVQSSDAVTPSVEVPLYGRGATDTGDTEDTAQDTGTGDTGDTVDTGDTGTVDTGDTGTVDTGDTGTVDTGDTGTVDTGDTGTVDTGDTGTVDTGGGGGAAGCPSTYTWIGSVQTCVVPAGVRSLRVRAWGAGGAGSAYGAGSPSRGGGGAFVDVTFAVTPGEVLSLYPGEGGPVPGGGGGATWAARSDGTVLFAAAGGGGAGTDGGSPLGSAHGGAGGGSFGEDGGTQTYAPYGYATGGTGATTSAGGAGGVGVGPGSGYWCAGTDGAYATGGMPGSGSTSCSAVRVASYDAASQPSSGNGSGGAGGAGLYGGGGGGSVWTYFGGGGGGGSSYAGGGTATGGSGSTPGNASDPDRLAGAGEGGVGSVWPSGVPSTPGGAGFIVLGP